MIIEAKRIATNRKVSEKMIQTIFYMIIFPYDFFKTSRTKVGFYESNAYISDFYFKINEY